MLHPLFYTLLAACLAPFGNPGQDPEPAAAPEASAPAQPSIDDFKWLAGHWRGTGLGGTCEEIWSEPMGGTMMGSFRLLRDDKVLFYELIVLGPDKDGFSMRVKHFSPEFVAWEEKDGAVRFPFESVEGTKAEFGGLRAERDGDRLVIQVKMSGRDGSSRWEPFELERVTPGS